MITVSMSIPHFHSSSISQLRQHDYSIEAGGILANPFAYHTNFPHHNLSEPRRRNQRIAAIWPRNQKIKKGSIASKSFVLIAIVTIRMQKADTSNLTMLPSVCRTLFKTLSCHNSSLSRSPPPLIFHKVPDLTSMPSFSRPRIVSNVLHKTLPLLLVVLLGLRLVESWLLSSSLEVEATSGRQGRRDSMVLARIAEVHDVAFLQKRPSPPRLKWTGKEEPREAEKRDDESDVGAAEGRRSQAPA